jgi:hypothetical protein
MREVRDIKRHQDNAGAALVPVAIVGISLVITLTYLPAVPAQILVLAFGVVFVMSVFFAVRETLKAQEKMLKWADDKLFNLKERDRIQDTRDTTQSMTNAAMKKKVDDLTSSVTAMSNREWYLSQVQVSFRDSIVHALDNKMDKPKKKSKKGKK